MSIDLTLTRSSLKVAYGLILQHITEIKTKEDFSGQLSADEISSLLQIPYKTVVEVFNQLKTNDIFKELHSPSH